AEPSVAQISLPWVGSVALKRTLPLNAVSPNGEEPDEPGAMSLIRVVPAAVPSVRQSSDPWLPSSPTKTKPPQGATRPSGPPGPTLLKRMGLPAPGLTSDSRWVPALVPSVTQGSQDVNESCAANRTCPWSTARNRGGEQGMHPRAAAPTACVPPGVPSVTQSSRTSSAARTVNRSLPPASTIVGRRKSLKLCTPLRSSFTGNVPAGVPSLFHKPGPCGPSATKKSR